VIGAHKGSSEDMRADFHVMADISQHTRVFPSQRGAELQKFVSDTKKNEKVAKVASHSKRMSVLNQVGIRSMGIPNQFKYAGSSRKSLTSREDFL